jgi:hypothetical protein
MDLTFVPVGIDAFLTFVSALGLVFYFSMCVSPYLASASGSL